MKKILILLALLVLAPVKVFAVPQDVLFGRSVPTASATDAAFTTTDGSAMAAAPGYRMRAISYSIVCGSSATAVTFNSKGSGAGTAITSPKTLGANGVSNADSEYGVFESKVDEKITVSTGSGSTCGVDLAYVYVRQIDPTATPTPTVTPTPTNTPTPTPTNTPTPTPTP